MTIKYSDVQNILDAILAKTGIASPLPHGVFWRQTNNYDQDYTLFTTGNVPGPGIPIINPTNVLQSNFYVILTNPNGLAEQGYDQMPEGGPWITDAGYNAVVAGTSMTGTQIQAALADWLSNNFPK